MQPIALDVSAQPLVPDQLEKLSILHREFEEAEAQRSRLRMRRGVIVANVLAWILIVTIVRLIFF